MYLVNSVAVFECWLQLPVQCTTPETMLSCIVSLLVAELGSYSLHCNRIHNNVKQDQDTTCLVLNSRCIVPHYTIINMSLYVESSQLLQQPSVELWCAFTAFHSGSLRSHTRSHICICPCILSLCFNFVTFWSDL